MWKPRERVPLPDSWEDRRIQSAAALLSVAANVEVNPTSADDAEERLVSIATTHGLDPDQIHRAMTEHEPFLAFQEADHALMEGAFYRVF